MYDPLAKTTSKSEPVIIAGPENITHPAAPEGTQITITCDSPSQFAFFGSRITDTIDAIKQAW